MSHGAYCQQQLKHDREERRPWATVLLCETASLYQIWRDDWHINRRRGGLNRLNQYSDLSRSTPRRPGARLQPRPALRAEQAWGGRVAVVISILRVPSRVCEEFSLNFPQNARLYVAIIEKLPRTVLKKKHQKTKSEKPLKEILPRREKVTQIFFPVQERTG